MFGDWATVLLLNPLAPILEAFSATIVHHRSPDLIWVAYSAFFSVSGFFLSWGLFKSLEPAFAENI